MRYRGKSGTAARYLCNGTFPTGGSYCVAFGGAGVDKRFSAELLRVISPLGLLASAEAVPRRAALQDDRQSAHRLKLQQLEYEAQRAFEQYDNADPRNRLVASELERRWNAKLTEVAGAQAALELAPVPPLSDDARREIEWLGHNFESVWESEDCPPEARKRIVRTLIEEAVVSLDQASGQLSFIVHWKGGHHTRFEMPKPPAGKGQATAEADIEIVRKLAPRLGDADITRVLNRLGRQTGKGMRWTLERVKAARVRASIPGRRLTVADPDVLGLHGAARACGVSDTTIRRLVAAELLVNHQTVPWAPWELRRVDLEAEPVRGIIQHLKATGKLVLSPVCSGEQPDLFQQNQRSSNARYSAALIRSAADPNRWMTVAAPQRGFFNPSFVALRRWYENTARVNSSTTALSTLVLGIANAILRRSTAYRNRFTTATRSSASARGPGPAPSSMSTQRMAASRSLATTAPKKSGLSGLSTLAGAGGAWCGEALDMGNGTYQKPEARRGLRARPRAATHPQ